MTTTILGTSTIGTVVARRLGAAGHRVVAWDRATERAANLSTHGIEIVDSAGEAVRRADLVLVLVLGDEAVTETLDAALPSLEPGALVIDMTTTSTATKRVLAARIRGVGCRAAEAPFFGTVPQAEKGELIAVVGCADHDLPDVENALQPLCSRLVRHGDVGDASALKLAANVLVFPMVELIVEAIALAEAQHVDPDALLALLQGALGSARPSTMRAVG